MKLLEYCLGRIKFKTSGGRLLNWLGEEVTL